MNGEGKEARISVVRKEIEKKKLVSLQNDKLRMKSVSFEFLSFRF